MTENRSIATAERDGFTHIEARCECGQITAIPFLMLKRGGQTTSETRIPSIAARLRCHRCGRKPERWRAWRQYMDGAMGYRWGVGQSD